MGLKFTVYTDHQPILAALLKTTEPTSGRQARQLAAIAEATSDVRHVDGKDNLVADALSRIDSPEVDDTPGFVSFPVPSMVPGSISSQPWGPPPAPSMVTGSISSQPWGPSPVPSMGPGSISSQPWRPPPARVNAIAPGIDYRELAIAQAEDQDVQDYRTAITNLKLADVPFSNGAFSVLCDTSTGVARPVVPETWRRRVFDTVHALSHPGARLTKRL